MKCQIPRRIPRVLPLVGHRDDVLVKYVEPFGIPRIPSTRSGHRVSVMFGKPPVQIEMIELLGPEHSSQRLPVHAALILVQRLRSNAVVELIRIEESGRKRLVEIGERIGRRLGAETQTNDLVPSAWNL